jgi:predicted N-acetyltransferase YhbS
MAAPVIRDLRPEDDIDQLTRLLNAAYRPLAEAGFRFLASHQDTEQTRKRLLAGCPLVAELDGELVGTITIYRTNPKSNCAWYRRPGVYYLGQLGIRPDLQGNGLGGRLMRAGEEKARQLGAEELALDTAEGAVHLRAWYERLGFAVVEFVSWEVTNYRSVVMSKRLVKDFPRANPSPASPQEKPTRP